MTAMTREEFNRVKQEFRRIDVREPVKCDKCGKILRMRNDIVYYYKLNWYCSECKFKLEMGQ